MMMLNFRSACSIITNNATTRRRCCSTLAATSVITSSNASTSASATTRFTVSSIPSPARDHDNHHSSTTTTISYPKHKQHQKNQQQQHNFFSNKRYMSTNTNKTFPAPRLFDYQTITSNLSVIDAIDSVEDAFRALATPGKVDVPMPMHIGIEETKTAGPGDCHIKGGYILGEETFTVKLACVSFYNNIAKGLPAGSGIFIVVDAITGSPLGIFQENRYMTDLRTGAAGGIALKYCGKQIQNNNNNKKQNDDDDDDNMTIGFIGCGAIARNMARAANAIQPGYKCIAYAYDGAEQFCMDMSSELGIECNVASTAIELCTKCDVIYTQTPGSQTVLELDWLQPGTTIIASGSDQPTKQEIPTMVLKNSKYISDLTKQTSKVGELRSALSNGDMSEFDVHAELGEVVAGMKDGRSNNEEIIVVDLTGTGAQDAAIGQVAWNKLSQL